MCLELRELTAFTACISKATVNCHVKSLRPTCCEETQRKYVKRPPGEERPPRSVSEALLNPSTHPDCQLSMAK